MWQFDQHKRQRRALQQLGLRQLAIERLEPRQLLAADVVISEFLASNDLGLKDGDGDSSDWIELFNTTASAIDLGGYYLTDDATELAKWALPIGTTIQPHSTLLVFASDKADAPPAGELHANFKLSADGEYLALVQADGLTIVDQFAPEFPPQSTDISYGLSMTATSTTLVDESLTMHYWVPTSAVADATWTSPGFDDSTWDVSAGGLGYENSPGSSTSYSSYLGAVVPSGTTTAYARFEFNLTDPAAFNTLQLQMLYDDGFVAYLNGQELASANAPTSPAWNSIAAGDMRSDDLVLSDYVEFDVTSHVDALQAGANVLAVHALNVASSSDMLMTARLTAGVTEIVDPLMYGNFAEPTPGAPNGQVFVGVVADTKFDFDRGFYSDALTLNITTETDGATIVYTTDGSVPTVDAALNVTNGVLYSGPLNIAQTTTLRAAAFKADYVPTNVDTQTYIFLNDVIQQTAQSTLAAGYPAFWGGRSADYGLDPDVIGPNDLFGGVYADQIVESLESIPSLSIVLDSDDFFGPNGIYANPTGGGVAWERPASAELIYPGETEGFQIDAGLRIAGSASRVLSKKNGLRLLFKSEYGATKLEFPLFGDGVSEFDTITIRPHFNDGWGWDGALGDPLYIRDQWFRDTQAAMGQPSSRGNLVHLYVNGLYWGLYNPSERPDASFSAETMGGDKDEYDVMYAQGVQDGTSAAYDTMRSLAFGVLSAQGTAGKAAAYQHLQGNFADGTDDPAAEDYLDVENLIDYMILNHYGGNNDWPVNNWYATRRRGPDSEGFRYVNWDTEIALALSSRTSINENNLDKTGGGAEAYGILRNYEEFRLQFADRIHKHLFNDGVLYVNPDSPAYDPAHPENNLPAARFAALADSVAASIVAESARWGDQHVSFPRTKNIDWQNSLNYMLGSYFTSRHGIVLNQWRAADLYPSTDAPELLVNSARQHGGQIEPGALLDFVNPNAGGGGVIYYTTDGSDPRLIGGSVNSASAQSFTGAVTLTGTTTIKARTLLAGEWSALTEATFVAANADFDGSGTVTGGDFLAWQRGLGTSPATPADGDANGDGSVDGDDLAVWQQQYGQAPTPQTAAALSSIVTGTAIVTSLDGFLASPISTTGTSASNPLIVATVNPAIDSTAAHELESLDASPPAVSSDMSGASAQEARTETSDSDTGLLDEAFSTWTDDLDEFADAGLN